MAQDLAAFIAFDLHPGALDGVAVGHLHRRVAFGEVLYLGTGFFGLVQLAGQCLVGVGVSIFQSPGALFEAGVCECPALATSDRYCGIT